MLYEVITADQVQRLLVLLHYAERSDYEIERTVPVGRALFKEFDAAPDAYSSRNYKTCLIECFHELLVPSGAHQVKKSNKNDLVLAAVFGECFEYLFDIIFGSYNFV